MTFKYLNTDLRDNGVFVVTIDVIDEVMNIINQQLIDEFEVVLTNIETSPQIKAVVLLSGKSNSFFAGADINMLNAVETKIDGTTIAIEGQAMFERMANCPKPFVIGIHGVCLGGGYEFALACHYRIASDDPSTKVGLPEVMLGLLPGGRGNSVLPRLISLPSALDMLLTGKQIDSKRAKRLGMVDEVVPITILETVSIKKAEELINNGGKIERKQSVKDKALRLPFVKNLIIKKAREQVLKKSQGLYPAPLAILDVVEQGLNKSLKSSLEFEAEKFGELTVSPEAKELINVYFTSTALKKKEYTDKDTKPITVNNVGVLGGGLMGAGIATVSIDKAKASVRIKDIRDEGLMMAVKYLSDFYKKRVKRRILTKEASKKKLNQFTTSLDYSGFQGSDLIIEAVFEDLKLKQQMVKDIEDLGNEKTIFATNTSSIPIADIAANAQRPENILGMHYFSPVEKMPLLEIIKHKGTSDQALATAVDFGRKQGKTVIVVNDSAGFYVNRILVPYMNAAIELGMEGVPFDQIDKALVKFGFPVGPIKLMDEVGIDICSKIQPILEDAFGERMQSSGAEKAMIKNKRLGKKVKKGFYVYDDPKKSKEIDPDVYTELKISNPKELAENVIVERCVYPMLNEAISCLEDKVIDSVQDGDMGAIFGMGFPPYLGGPFRYIDTIGATTLKERLQEFESSHGTKYSPTKLLLEKAEKNNSFY
jgi:3-hydroxyacyl-CoA dehydrogenase/enoyl-CoA hydratase/3-hydroxybutyryl-CoA epimerase